MTPRLRMAVASAIAIAITVVTPGAHASGGDGFSENAFVPEFHVTAPELPAYAAGRLGVLSGSHWRVYQVLAWRALHGHPLPAADLQALSLRDWRVGPEGKRSNRTGNDADPEGVTTWLAARAQLPAAPPLTASQKPGTEATTANFVVYENCPAAAFERAALTLRARLQQHGAAAAAPWLAAQDAVFANCAPVYARTGDGWVAPAPVLPLTLPAAAPAWLAQDHAYQTAAALFYNGQHTQARERFLVIAADKRSPWQPLGAYLASRSLIRQATLMPPAADKEDGLADAARSLLEQARRELQAQAATDPAAAALIGWVDARLRPAERAAELARALQSGPLAGAERVGMLSDYLRLLDKLEQVQAQAAAGTSAPASAPVMTQAAEPLTAWIGFMQAGMDRDAAKRRALMSAIRARWQQDRDSAWLLPLAAAATRLGDLQPDEQKLLRALPSTSPAWHTAQWHLARLQLVSDQAAAADAAIDKALASPDLAFTTRNRWLQLKLASARSVSALLAAAPRTPAETGSGVPIPDEGKPVATALDMDVDEDFAQRLYRHLPLAQLDALLAQPAFPFRLRASHAEVVFTRALLLQDWAVADRLARGIAQPRATTRHLYERYLAAKAPADKQLAAALILANTPELNPSPVDARGQTVYWGCPGYGAGQTPSAVYAIPVQFLSAAEQAATERERAVLDGLPIRTRWLADALLPWAARKPDDAEAPKALHFLVASTRMECSTAAAPKPGAPNHSREAFNLLHKLWPKSEWAAKTKYWF